MVLNITVTLPAIDGLAEIGIAVGTDKGVPDEKKLHILAKGSKAERILYAAASAASMTDTTHRELVISAAIAVEKFGLVQKERDGEGPDCDVVIDKTASPALVNAANNEQLQEEVKRLLVAKKDEDALALMVASKVTYWQTNHHTGGGKLAHYVKKVYDLKFKGDAASEQISSDSATSDTHMMAHWSSTCFLLNKVGFLKVRKTEGIRPETGADAPTKFDLTQDVKIRTSVFPAGHAKHGACKEALKRLSRMSLVAALPVAGDCVSFLEECDQIKQNEAHYHMGAAYLTEDKVVLKMEPPKICWRMAKFVHAFYPETKLSEASVFSKENIANYDDVYASWEGICNAMVAAALDMEIDLQVLGGVAAMRTNGNTIDNIMGLLKIEPSTEVKMAVNAIAESNGEEAHYTLN